jgi:hypothetical protein
MKHKFILSVLKCLIFCISGICQETRAKKPAFDTEHSFGFKGEYIYQGQNYISVGLGYLNPRIINGGSCNSFILGTEGFSINTDLALTNNKFHIIPKLSYEYTLMLIGAKLSLGTVTDFKSNHIIFSPEIGLSFVGRAYLFYGYNFVDDSLYNLSGHKLTLGINLLKSQ